jgi:hypothetical protein
MSEAKFDPHRRLCPDGTCVGVISEDGRCRVCGRSASGGGGEPPPPTGGFAPPAFDDDDDDADEDAGADAGEPRAAAGAAGGFDPQRKLCPDGDCIGVIGADGICNVCGKKAE